MIIARGRISHTLRQSVKYVFWSLFNGLSSKGYVSKLEHLFASYIGRKHCIAFPHARTALYFLLKEMDLPVGSKILMPALTIKFILDVVLSLGLKPVYVDYDLETYCFDLAELKKNKHSDVKVMLATPIFGVVPNMAYIKEFCIENGISLIEDFSQCLNGTFKNQKVGTFGVASVYSASSIKTLDTLGGGLLVTDDTSLYESLVKERNNLKNPNRWLLIKRSCVNLIRNIATMPFIFNLLTIYAIRIMTLLNPENALRQTGTRDKARIEVLPADWFVLYSSIQAKIGLENIGNILANDEKRIFYAKTHIKQIGVSHFAKGAEGAHNVFWQLPIKTNNAEKFHNTLRAKGVDSALSSLQLISSLTNYPGATDLPNASVIFTNRLFIPCYAYLKESDLKIISSACISAIEATG
jgi:perosamine synthetase